MSVRRVCPSHTLDIPLRGPGPAERGRWPVQLCDGARLLSMGLSARPPFPPSILIRSDADAYRYRAASDAGVNQLLFMFCVVDTLNFPLFPRAPSIFATNELFRYHHAAL